MTQVEHQTLRLEQGRVPHVQLPLLRPLRLEPQPGVLRERA